MLLLYKKVFLGITSDNLKKKMDDINKYEVLVYGSLVCLIILFGIKPEVILDYTTSSLDRITKLYPISIF